MKILYYVPEITHRSGGMLQYSCALLKILAQDTSRQIYVLHNSNDSEILLIIGLFDNVHHVPTKKGKERWYEKIARYGQRTCEEYYLSKGITKHLTILTSVDRLCDTYCIDVVYCPYQGIPHTVRPVITTLHDVQELHFPEMFSPMQRLERAKYYKSLTEVSTLIMVSYEHVKLDLIKYFNCTAENVCVCLLEMKNLWFSKFSPNDLVDLTNYNIHESFILYPAATWRHKNHINLIRSLAYLRDTEGVHINAVFTGNQTEYSTELLKEVGHLDLGQQVSFLGIVPENVLYTLYNNAVAVVVPTLYEAGSFPLMESILMKIPVICSAVTSLPETIGDERFLFNPKDIREMSEKIRSICQDEKYREDNISNSTIQSDRLINTSAQDILKKVLMIAVGNMEIVK